MHAETAALQRSSSEHISAVQGLIHGTKGSKRKREEAFAENGLTVEQFGNRRIGIDEPLAWQHMDSVVGMDYLRREYLRSREGIVTGDCRLNCNGCFGDRCGTLCDMHKPDSVWEIRKKAVGSEHTQNEDFRKNIKGEELSE